MDTTRSSSDGTARASSAPSISLAEALGPRALLLSGALLTVLSANRWSIPELAWVSSAPWLAHAALYRSRRDRAWLALTVFVAITISTAKVISPPIPYAMALAFSPPAALSAMVTLALWSLSVRKLGWARSVLVLAAIATAGDWLTFTGSPLGTWNMAVNTQLDNLALLQSLALGGPSLLSWLFAVTNGVAALALGAPTTVSRRAPLLATMAIVLAAYGYGLARLEHSQGGPVLRAAAVRTDVGPSPAGMPSAHVLARNEDELFARSLTAAQRGAELIVWNEAATIVTPAHEADLLARGRQFAREHRVELVLAYAVLLSQSPVRFDNQYRWFSTDGVEVERYRKHHPVPGEGSIEGTEPLATHAHRYGTAAGAICYDFDFPALGRALAAKGAGVVVVPSSDWAGVDPAHGLVARTRAIEGGFSVVRPVRWATSYGFDAYGRVLAALPARDATEHVLLVDVHTAPVRTPYARFGDWPVLASLALALFGAAVLRR